MGSKFFYSKCEKMANKLVFVAGLSGFSCGVGLSSTHPFYACNHHDRGEVVTQIESDYVISNFPQTIAFTIIEFMIGRSELGKPLPSKTFLRLISSTLLRFYGRRQSARFVFKDFKNSFQGTLV